MPEKIRKLKLRRLMEKHGLDEKTSSWIGKKINPKEWHTAFGLFKKHEIEVSEGRLLLKGKTRNELRDILKKDNGVFELGRTLDLAEQMNMSKHQAVRISAGSFKELQETHRLLKEHKSIERGKILKWSALYGTRLTDEIAGFSKKNGVEADRVVYGVSRALNAKKRESKTPKKDTLQLLKKAGELIEDDYARERVPTLIEVLGKFGEKNVRAGLKISKKWGPYLDDVTEAVARTSPEIAEMAAELKKTEKTEYRVKVISSMIKRISKSPKEREKAKELVRQAIRETKKKDNLSLADAVIRLAGV